jgi:hypothetical protein
MTTVRPGSRQSPRISSPEPPAAPPPRGQLRGKDGLKQPSRIISHLTYRSFGTDIDFDQWRISPR